MTQTKIVRFLQAGVLLIPVLVIIYLSTQSMRANAWYFSARNSVDSLEFPQTNNAPLLAAQQAISLATTLDPSHPHYWHLYAHITLLTLNTHEHTAAQTFSIYQQTEQALLRSVALRQTWSQTWIALAKVVSYQEGPTERVYEYIQQAKKAGPYKLDVHLGVMQIALINWQTLSPKFKALYLSELSSAVKYGYKFYDVFNIAQQVNQLPVLCLSLQFGSQFEAVRNTYMFKKHCG